MKKPKAKTKKRIIPSPKAELRDGEDAMKQFAAGMAHLLAGGPQPKPTKMR